VKNGRDGGQSLLSLIREYFVGEEEIDGGDLSIRRRTGLHFQEKTMGHDRGGANESRGSTLVGNIS